MVMMAGRVAAEYDAATHTLLASAVTDAGTDRDVNTAVSVDRLTAAYWDNGEVPMGLFAVNILVTAISGASSTFNFILEGYTSNSFGSARTELASLKLVSGVHAAGSYRMLVDAKTAALLVSGLTHIALSTTKATDSPSITYSAWLSFLKAA